MRLFTYSNNIFQINVYENLGEGKSGVTPPLVYLQSSDVADMLHLNRYQKMDGNVVRDLYSSHGEMDIIGYQSEVKKNSTQGIL